MTMRFMDGCGDVNDSLADQLLKWSAGSGSPSFVTGVYGKGKAFTNTNPLLKNLGIAITTGMMGFHYFIPSGIVTAGTICSFVDGSTTQVDLRINTSGQLFFTRNGTTIGTTSPAIPTVNQWYWLEMQVTISSTVGIANLYVNATSYLTQSGLNTQATGNSSFNSVEVESTIGGPSGAAIDSFHTWDTTAGDVSSFPYGEHIIDSELASAVGSNTFWNKGGSTINAQNYEQVNETNQDGDTTYVWMSASGAGDVDSYQFSDLLESTGTIGTVAINTISRIDDAGPHIYQHYALSSASSVLSSNISPGANYLNFQTFQGTDPNTTAPWTVAGLNEAEFGYEFIS